MTIEEIIQNDEKQIFDRKSIQIDSKALAISLVAFANADGGTIAIGIVKTKNGEMQVSSAAILLFGKNPQIYFPRARVRFVKYDGIEEKFGTEMNVIKDVIFEGTILQMIRDSIAYLETQIQEKPILVRMVCL